MNERLKALLEMSRGKQMSPAEQAQQRISFAYGNLKIEDDRVAKPLVARLAQSVPPSKS